MDEMNRIGILKVWKPEIEHSFITRSFKSIGIWKSAGQTNFLPVSVVRDTYCITRNLFSYKKISARKNLKSSPRIVLQCRVDKPT